MNKKGFYRVLEKNLPIPKPLQQIPHLYIDARDQENSYRSTSDLATAICFLTTNSSSLLVRES